MLCRRCLTTIASERPEAEHVATSVVVLVYCFGLRGTVGGQSAGQTIAQWELVGRIGQTISALPALRAPLAGGRSAPLGTLAARASLGRAGRAAGGWKRAENGRGRPKMLAEVHNDEI